MNSIDKKGTVKIDLELSSKEAFDLSQLVKRINFCDVYDCAVDEKEAYSMISALSILQDALARHGYNPR